MVGGRTVPLLLLVLFLPPQDGAASEPTWRRLAGPPCGVPITALAADPSRPDAVYVGGCGVFRLSTIESDEPFTPIFSGFPVYMIALAPTVTTTIYVISLGPPGPIRGLRDRVLSRSADGGVSWSDLLTSIDSIVVDPTDPMTVYAGAWPSFSYYAVGVYKTRDGGIQWVNSTAGVANVSALAINPRDPTILYAGSDDSILKSEDAGTSWSAVNTSGSVFALAVDPTVPSIVYAGCALLGFPSSSGVLRTRDSGASWSFFPIPGYTFGSMVVDPLSRAVFAATDGGVLRSDDEGEHWAAFGQGLTGLPVSSLALGSQRTLYAGTQDGVFVVSLLSRVGRDSLPRRVSPR